MRSPSLRATSVALILSFSSLVYAQEAPNPGPTSAAEEPADPATAETSSPAPGGPAQPAIPPVGPAVPAEPAPVEAPAASAEPPPLVAPAQPPPLSSVDAAPAPTPKGTWTPIYTGSFFARHETRVGYSDVGVARAPRFLDGDATFFRARFGIGTGLIDTGDRLKVGLQFNPQAYGVFGTLPSTLNDAALGLHEGYLRVQGRVVRADLGRFELDYGDSLVIGNLDWNEAARTFDGVRAHIAASPDSAWLDVFATSIDEGRPDVTRSFDGDVYFMGLYAGLGPAVMKGLNLDAYALVRAWPETKGLKLDPSVAASPTYDRERAGEATFGARVKQTLGLIDYRFEGGVQAGSRPVAAPLPSTMPAPTQQAARDVLAYHADAELGLNLVPDRLRLSGEALYASGDDSSTSDTNEAWDELYPTAHKFLGLSDAFVLNGVKRTNVVSGIFHVTSRLMPGLTFQADGHMFARVQDTFRPGSTKVDKGFAAIEIDTGLVYVLTKGLKLRGMYALFMPSEKGYTTTGSRDTAQYGEVELRYDLGT